MALLLNKTSLKQQHDHLAMYKRFLPSLDLKRQQLLTAQKDARVQLEQIEKEIIEHHASLETVLRLLGSSTVSPRHLAKLIKVKQVEIGEENVVGCHLPSLINIDFEELAYSTLVMPFWVDDLVVHLRRSIELHIRSEIQQRRAERLVVAARRITQRVNLFEKVLIPEANRNVKKILVFLSDEERAAVVRSKIAKRKHLTSEVEGWVER